MPSTINPAIEINARQDFLARLDALENVPNAEAGRLNAPWRDKLRNAILTGTTVKVPNPAGRDLLTFAKDWTAHLANNPTANQSLDDLTFQTRHTSNDATQPSAPDTPTPTGSTTNAQQSAPAEANNGNGTMSIHTPGLRGIAQPTSIGTIGTEVFRRTTPAEAIADTPLARSARTALRQAIPAHQINVATGQPNNPIHAEILDALAIFYTNRTFGDRFGWHYLTESLQIAITGVNQTTCADDPLLLNDDRHNHPIIVKIHERFLANGISPENLPGLDEITHHATTMDDGTSDTPNLDPQADAFAEASQLEAGQVEKLLAFNRAAEALKLAAKNLDIDDDKLNRWLDEPLAKIVRESERITGTKVRRIIPSNTDRSVRITNGQCPFREGSNNAKIYGLLLQGGMSVEKIAELVQADIKSVKYCIWVLKTSGATIDQDDFGTMKPMKLPSEAF